MADTWDSVMRDLRSLQSKRENLEDEARNSKRKMQNDLENDMDEFQRMLRQESDNMADINSALEGPALTAITLRTNDHFETGSRARYAMNDYITDRSFDIDRELNQKLDRFDEDEAIIRKKLRDL